MKCLNKILNLSIIIILLFSFTGCGSNEIPIQYGQYSMDDNYNIEESMAESKLNMFAEDLCATDKDILDSSNISAQSVKAAGVFDVAGCETLYAYNVNEKINPASLTKIMTTLVVLENANLDDVVTVEEFKLDEGSKFGIKPGDKFTVRDLLYLNLVESANDASIVLANYVAGDEASFVELMNNKAKQLGATNTNFANVHGLTNESHYTTAYDLYLMFNAALKYDEFKTIISTASYEVTYTNSNGEVVTKTSNTTNKFLTGEYKAPGSLVVVGGKTGTTNAAGKCLIIYSNSADGRPYISIIMGAADEQALYNTMISLCNDTIK